MDINDAIWNRRSVRRYLDKPITEEVIRKIIEAGRMAPSAHNGQPWRFVVVSDKERIRELSDHVKGWYDKVMHIGRLFSKFNKTLHKTLESAKKRVDSPKDLFFYDAPVVVMVCCRKSRFSLQGCACAAQNMMLAARAIDIGSCWIGFADVALNNSRSKPSWLKIPKGNVVAATLIFGYTEKFPPLALPRKEKADVVDWVNGALGNPGHSGEV